MFESLSGYKIPQRDDELAALIELFKKHDIRSYLEIGSRYGDSLFHIASSLPIGSKVVSVDLPGGYWGRDDSQPHLKNVVQKLRDMEYDAHVHFGDSTTLATRNQVASYGKFDAIMIDGDHRFEGLTLDWVNYGPKANKLIIFHDIDGWQHFEGKSGAPIEVPDVWKILKRHYQYQEIVGQERGMGIGVLFAGTKK